MQNLPPLNALRAFEVAARVGSFVQAGTELGVTSAAVSQQVKHLEQHLGKHLFIRQGNRIALTDVGRTIYPRIEQAFGDITSLTASIREGQARAKLVVSVLPSLAEQWLIPRLSGYSENVSIEIRVEKDPVHFARDGVDLRITYGGSLYPDFRVESLFNDHIVPICAPGFMDPYDSIASLPESAFIHTDWGPDYVTQASWPAWMAATRQHRYPEPASGLRLQQTSLAIAAARASLGVALTPEKLAGEDLQTGRLIIPEAGSLPMQFDYVMVTPHALARKSRLRQLVRHLAGAGL